MKWASVGFVGLLLTAQDLRIGTIDIFGLHRIPEASIRSVLGVRVGDSITPSNAFGKSLKRRIAAIAGVSRADVSLDCCGNEGRATLTIGILEEGFPTPSFRPAPTSPVRLPKEIIKTYRRCMDAWEHAIRIGDNQDSVDEGHSLMANSDVRAIQKHFISIARNHLGLFRMVLRESSSDEHRAAAAWIIGYAPDKASVTEDLLRASLDPNALVRNNAMRSLWAIASLSMRRPELNIQIPGSPFIDLLNSIVSSDRNKALAVLREITQTRPHTLLTELRDHALPSLVQMARKPGGFSAYVLLGRIDGIAEERITESWNTEERQGVIIRIAREE